MDGRRIPFALVGAFAAATVLVAAVAFLGPRYGRAVATGAGLGLGLGAAATLLSFRWVLRASARGSRDLFKLFGIGFVTKVVLLVGGTLAGQLGGHYHPAAYAVGFAAGFTVVAAVGVAALHRRGTREGTRP
ncbi:MAG: hypothetical protein L0323_21670 [Planctomycetes bacterium]|nr:hypothetical protein [Planctomycetota bacterium]